MMQLSRKYTMLLTNLAVICSLVIICSCKKSPSEPEKTAQDWIQEGWQQFEAKQYTDAINSFNSVVNLNPPDSVAAIAYCGIGWSQGKLYNYEVAYNNFSFAVQRDSASPGPYVVHAYVGRAGVLQKKNLYNDAINDALKALSLSGTYEFTYDHSIKFTDIHFLLAEAYYHTLQYSAAQERVDFLRNLFVLPAINWSARPVIVDGVSFATYHEALLKAIEGLRNMV